MECLLLFQSLYTTAALTSLQAKITVYTFRPLTSGGTLLGPSSEAL